MIYNEDKKYQLQITKLFCASLLYQIKDLSDNFEILEINILFINSLFITFHSKQRKTLIIINNSIVSHKMLPPRQPRPSSNLLHSDKQLIIIPHLSGGTNNNANNRYTSSSLDSRSRVSKYEHLRTANDKRKALGKRKFINQLAYLDFEDKQIEIHTKYTMVSKATAMKKIKAKNLLADFPDEEQQIQLGFEQLMDYKYGPHGIGNNQSNNNFFFQKQQLIHDYVFCPHCDTIHNDHIEVHQKLCREKITLTYQQYDKTLPFYISYSFKRIQSALKRTTGQEYDEIKVILRKFIKIQQKPTTEGLQISGIELQKCLKQMSQMKKDNPGDTVLQGIINKILLLYNKPTRQSTSINSQKQA